MIKGSPGVNSKGILLWYTPSMYMETGAPVDVTSKVPLVVGTIWNTPPMFEALTLPVPLSVPDVIVKVIVDAGLRDCTAKLPPVL